MQRIPRGTLIAALALSGLACAAAPPAGAEEIFAITRRPPNSTIVPSLFSFDSAAPGTISTPLPLPLTGMPITNQLIGIDFRPSTGQLYGVTSSPDRLFTIDTATGEATLAASLGRLLIIDAGLDFDPVTDELRVFSNQGEGSRLNLRINPDTGAVARDPLLSYVAGDPNFGRRPNLLGLAYTNSVVGATSAALYGIDASTVSLVAVDAVGGALRTVGPLGWDFFPLEGGRYLGFDISGATGVAYAAVAPSTTGFPARLYTVDLDTGAATLVGAIGDGTSPLPVIGIAVAPAQSEVIPEPTTLALLCTGLIGAGAAAVRRRRKAGTSAGA